MLSDDTVTALESAVDTCDAARRDLEAALTRAEKASDDADHDEALQAIATAIQEWGAGQEQFADAVDASSAPDIPMAALLLKNETGTDAMNARRGVPGVSVDGTDQPFDVDLSGMRGSALTDAITTYVEDDA